MTYLGLKFLLWTSRDFWFQKTVRYVFSIAINVFLWDLLKLLVSQGWNSKLQYKHYMEKNKQGRGGGGEGKDMEFSGALKK